MVHLFRQGGFNIAVDGCSGSVHLVDDLAYDIIGMAETAAKDAVISAMLEKYAGNPDITRAEIENCLGDIERLRGEGKLFSPDQFAPLAEKSREKKAGVVKALCLHVAHACDLTCSYCFAGQGKYSGESALMPYETGKKALDFLIADSGDRKNLEVDFFGGEPLLNFDVVKKLVAYARSREKETGKRFRFTLTTNGMLIDDDVIEFSNREMYNVVLSLDGRKEVHDRFRVDAAGRGSYDVIVPKFRKFVKARQGKNYYIRGTFTHYNPDFTRDVEQMLELGFRRISMEPVVAKPGDPVALTAEDLKTVLSEYEKLAEMILDSREKGDPFEFYHYNVDLSGGPCIYKRISGCGSGGEYLAVTPAGDLYPCHRFAGDEAFKIGNIYDGITNTRLRDVFASRTVYSQPECSRCWAKFYCAGGCAAAAYEASGSVNGIYPAGCEMFRRRMECAIYIRAASGGNTP